MTAIPKLEEIKVSREELGLTQKKFAKMCDIKPSLLNMIEKGNTKPSYDSLVKIFDVIERESEKSIEKLKTARKICVRVSSVKKSDYIEDIIKIMKSKDFSQIPVIDSTGCLGLVTEHSILKFITNNGKEALHHAKAKDAMDISPPILDENQKITQRILNLLYDSKCILVSEQGKIIGIITKIDAIRGVIKK